jgi:DcmR-like sensory protein
MADAPRSSGLDVLGNLAWGTHFCLFYATKNDFLDVLLPYFKAGLQGNEFCLWVITKIDPVTKEEAWRALEEAVPDLPQRAAARSIELVSHDDWFLEGDEFELDRPLRRLKDLLEDALARGYDGMRFNGSPAWLQQDRWQDFHALEHRLDELIAGRAIIALCHFSLMTSRAEDMLAAATSHHFTVARQDGAWRIIQVTDAKPRISSLTPRELEVLTWAARGQICRRDRPNSRHCETNG